jgi:hypothetical protein
MTPVVLAALLVAGAKDGRAADPPAQFSLATVALERAVMPKREELVAACSKRWGALLPLTVPRTEVQYPSLPPEATEATQFELPTGRVLVGLSPTPVPGMHPAPPDTAFPEMFGLLAGHKAKLIVFFFAREHDAVDRALILTRVVACLLDVTPAVGVLWKMSATSRAQFLQLSKDIGRWNLPLRLWVATTGVRLEGPDTRFMVHTYGMHLFGRRELGTTSRDPHEAARLLYALAQQVIDKNADLKDGVRVDLGGAHKVKTRLGKAPWDKPPGEKMTWLDL